MGYGFHYFIHEPLDRATRVEAAMTNFVAEQIKNWDDSTIDVSKKWITVHVVTAAQLARVLAWRRRQDPELAFIAALVHDIGVVTSGGFEKDHAAKGYEPAKRLLESTKLFTADEIEMLAGAVKRHSEKMNVGNWLDELVKDADVLDCALHGVDFSKFEHHYKRFKNTLAELGVVKI